MQFGREREFILFGLSSDDRSWRGVGMLAAVLIGTLLIAAIISPWVYWGVLAWSKAAPNELNLYLAEKDFPRYFDRLRWLSVILLLPLLLKRCGLLSWSSLGYASSRREWREAVNWFGVGLAMLAIVAAVQIFTVGLNLKLSLISGEFTAVLMIGLMSGLLVAFVEETIFRGVVLRMFYTAISPIAAVIVSALLFAALHFKKVPGSIGLDETVSLGSGFYVGIWVLFSVFTTFDIFKFINLFFAGLMLNFLFLKSRSLWPCIGLHAGWVCFRAVYRKVAETNSDAPVLIWGSETVIDGIFPTFIMGLFVLALGYRYYHETSRSESKSVV